VLSYSELVVEAAPDDVPVFEPLLEPLSGLLGFDSLGLLSFEPLELELELGTLPRLSVT